MRKIVSNRGLVRSSGYFPAENHPTVQKPVFVKTHSPIQRTQKNALENDSVATLLTRHSTTHNIVFSKRQQLKHNSENTA